MIAEHDIITDRAQRRIDLLRDHMKRKAALRCVQECRSFSVCTRSNLLDVFPSNEIPENWRVVDTMDMESPDLRMYVDHRC